jgi:hypothetical protein
MSADRFADRIGKMASRRKFLTKAGASALAAAFSVLGLQQAASASTATVAYKCCHLCYWPSPTACSGARCGWSWTCCLNHQLWRCVERKDGNPCDASCTSAICSQAYVVGSC